MQVIGLYSNGFSNMVNVIVFNHFYISTKKEEWNAIIRIDCLSCYVYNWFCNVYLFDWLPSVFNLSSLKCNITKKKEVNVQRDIQKQTWSWLPFENVLRLIFLYKGIPDKNRYIFYFKRRFSSLIMGRIFFLRFTMMKLRILHIWKDIFCCRIPHNFHSLPKPLISTNK